MNIKAPYYRSRRLKVVVGLVAGVVLVSILLSSIFVPEGPPSPYVPWTETERTVLKLAETLVHDRPASNLVPVGIKKRDDANYMVTFWTPKMEEKLLGPRQVVVNLELEVAEFVPRE